MVYDRWVRLSVIVRVSLSVMLSYWGLRSATCTPGSITICMEFLQIVDVFDEFLVSCRTTRGFLRKPGECEPPGLHRGCSLGSFRQVRKSGCDSAENRQRRSADFDGDALQVLGGTLFDRPQRLVDRAPGVLPFLLIDGLDTIVYAVSFYRRREKSLQRPLAHLKQVNRVAGQGIFQRHGGPR